MRSENEICISQAFHKRTLETLQMSMRNPTLKEFRSRAHLTFGKRERVSWMGGGGGGEKWKGSGGWGRWGGGGEREK